jgi:hypothetical protein
MADAIDPIDDLEADIDRNMRASVSGRPPGFAGVAVEV